MTSSFYNSLTERHQLSCRGIKIKFAHFETLPVGFIPMALMQNPNSLVDIVPPPSASNSLNACRNSATCSSVKLWGILFLASLHRSKITRKSSQCHNMLLIHTLKDHSRVFQITFTNLDGLEDISFLELLPSIN